MGRFGSFWASLLSKEFDVAGYSRSGRDFPDNITRITEEQIGDYDTVFLCCAINSVEEVLVRIAGRLKPGTVVIDTCSVKVSPAALMEKHLRPDCGIIATHPMFGPDSGRNGVEGLPIAVCAERINREKLNTILGFFSQLQLRIEELTAEEHDHEAAYSQGITHFIGRTLDLLKLQPSRISTTGYEDLLHIVQMTCNDQWQLFLDLQKFNPYTEEMRKKLHSSIEEMLIKLDSIKSIGDN